VKKKISPSSIYLKNSTSFYIWGKLERKETKDLRDQILEYDLPNDILGSTVIRRRPKTRKMDLEVKSLKTAAG